MATFDERVKARLESMNIWYSREFANKEVRIFNRLVRELRLDAWSSHMMPDPVRWQWKMCTEYKRRAAGLRDDLKRMDEVEGIVRREMDEEEAMANGNIEA